MLATLLFFVFRCGTANALTDEDVIFTLNTRYTTFTITDGNTIPTVITTSISTYDATSATMGGEVIDDGGATVTERGVVYSSTDTDPEIGDTDVTKDENGSGKGSFSESISGLSAITTYYVKAYAINSAGTSYGSVESITITNNPPTFTSSVVTSVAEGDDYSYTITTSDPDGDKVSVTATSKPDWLSLNIVYEVRTLAGSGSSGEDDGTGSSANFNNPTGVAVDASGNVCVADRDNHKIRKISPSGEVSTLAGSGFAGDDDGTGDSASFRYPSGVALDASGNVYVADQGNNKIRKISPSGEVSTLAGSDYGSADGTGSNASFNGPIGVTVDTSGNVYVADAGNHKIRKISPTGEVSTLAGSDDPGSADGTGRSASFDYPTMVTLDASDNVYVDDTYNHKIRKINPTGKVSTLAGSGDPGSTDGTGSSASFNGPIGVALDTGGNVYVADFFNHKIRKISSSGEVSALAGSGDPGSTDGTGSSASFNYPVGVAVDASASIYVADQSNHKIRKITSKLVLEGNSSGQAGPHDVVLSISDGKGGSVEQTFTITVISVPTINTTPISTFYATSAAMGGEVTDDGGATIIERGVVYSSTNTNPQIGDSDVTNDDNSLEPDSFSEFISRLSPGTTYYVKAYATNLAGTSYGSVETFTTSNLTTISVNDPSVTEGNSGTSILTFTVSLSQAAWADGATVDYTTSDGTAASESDYTSTSGTMTFISGETSKTIDVSVSGDEVLEADETIILTLFNETGMDVVISDDTGTGTITNDDAAIVTIADVNGNEDDGTIIVTATLDHGVQDGFTVDVSTTDGTATTDDSDYTAVNKQTLTFSGTAGEMQTLDISLGADEKVEMDETLTVSMSNIVPTTITSENIDITDDAIVTIDNDDAATVTIADVSANEDDGAVTITAILDYAVQGGFTIDISTADGTATTSDNDYTAVNSQMLTFSGTAGEMQIFDITLIPDDKVEGNETLLVSISNVAPTMVSLTDIDITDVATVTIVNNDHAPIIATSQSFKVKEESPAGTQVGNVSATDADETGTLQDWTIMGGNIDVDNDGNLAFTINSRTGEITVKDADDLMGGHVLSFDLTLTVNDGVNTSKIEIVTISIIQINDAPSFTKGTDQTVLEDAGFRTIYNWATDLSAGPADESGQSIFFHVSNDNENLFSTQPAIDSDGTLTFTPAENANGTATVTVSLSDNGGTDNGGEDTSDHVTFTISVIPVNDEPSFTIKGDLSILAGAASHTFSGWVRNISAGPGDESSQQLIFHVSNDNNSFFTAQPAVNSDGDLNFTLADGVSGDVTITVSLSDDGGIANEGDDTSDETTFSINIGKLSQTISFETISDKKVGQDLIELTAIGGDSGLPVTYTITTDPASGVATLADNSIIIENVGTVTITASQAGNNMYKVAADVSQSFTIAPNELFLPTLFTPNGDGHNDKFMLRGGGGIDQMEFSIFDRNGNLVYHTSSWEDLTQQGWDGKLDNKEQPLGTYIWVISGKYTNELPLLVNGNNTGIIRLLR